MSVGNDTYGITGIPTTVAGRWIVRRAGLVDSTMGILPRFRPQRCVKPYDPTLVDVFSVLELLNYLLVLPGSKSRILLPCAMGLLL